MKLLLACIMLLTACGAAAAQMPAPVVNHEFGGPVKNPGTTGGLGSDPAVYSKSVTGTILRLDPQHNLLVLEGSDKSRLVYRLEQGVEWKADKDTSLAGRKDLSVNDYRPGEVVRVSYRVADLKVLAVRLKRAKP